MVRSCERSRSGWRVALSVSLACLALGACLGKTATERAREAAEKVQRSMENVDAPALNQHVDPKVVEEVQRALTRLNEYQGPITGKIDQVTVNAIQAFQRKAGIEDTGLLDARTLQALRAAAGQAG